MQNPKIKSDENITAQPAPTSERRKRGKRSLEPPPQNQVELSNDESADNYRAVIATDQNTRLIESKCATQWILQTSRKTSHGRKWKGRQFCRTKNGLLRSVYADDHEKQFGGWWIASTILLRTIELLPDKFETTRHSSLPR